MTLGIAKKLFIFFFFFILIFYGTVFDLFINVRDMSKTSARIVSINNQVAALSKNLRDSLIDMDANIKKFRLLKKDVYYDYFETARQAYHRDLNRILRLDSAGRPPSQYWDRLYLTYTPHTRFREKQDIMALPGPWIAPALMTQWIEAISAARKDNDSQIENALIRINDQSRKIVQNSVIGFGISILAGIFGVLFISRSMLTPLNKLKSGLKHVSDDNYTHKIAISSKDEFGELAAAFNDMNRQLKADEEIRSDFIATLSHEIRTPLSSIRESVNMIAEEVLGPVNEKQKKFLTIAGNEIARITGLLNHLLDTSMLGPGTEKPLALPLDPNQLARDAAQSITAAAKSRDIDVRFRDLADAPMVAGDQKEIMQVFMNILDNALKFSPEDSQVEILLSKGPGNGFITFSISDTGPGIPEDKQDLIFKKYYRAGEVRKHMSGVGLGLSISRRIIHAHGGKIFVKNNTDRGCTFSFTLPVHTEYTP
ncbi:MAG: HAMP domain-containing sensor histidine kinase [Desulfobacter sp.]